MKKKSLKLGFTILKPNSSQFQVSGFSSGNIFAPSQNQRCIYSSLLFVAVGHGAWIFYQWLCHSPFPQLIHDSIIGSLAHHINLWINGSKKAEDPEAVAGMRLRKQRWVWAIWSTIACFVMGPWVAAQPICMELNRWSWYVGTCITNLKKKAYKTFACGNGVSVVVQSHGLHELKISPNGRTARKQERVLLHVFQ